MTTLRLFLATSILLGACSDSSECADFKAPERGLQQECVSANVADPTMLAACLKGSGYAGSWVVDDHGLPAFDFAIEQRCDSVAQVVTSGGKRQVDPLHVIGSGNGMVAMAHASGAVEIYSNDRGGTWLNHFDSWQDPENKSFPVQLGGGFNYLVVDDEVRSTRYNDFSVGKALRTQSRRFGVGYYETITTFDDLRVTRRVFASNTQARALVAEVTLENLSNANLNMGLVEFWDLNLHQLAAETTTSEFDDETRRASITRRRRAAAAEFEHTLRYAQESQIASAQSVAKSLPAGVVDRTSPAAIDYFPAEIFLAAIDMAAEPDAVWLSDEELWQAGTTERKPPPRASEAGVRKTRSVELDGARQSGVLALRVPVVVPTGGAITRRFSFGYATETLGVEESVEELRSRNGELLQDAAISWKERLAWLAVDAEDSGVLQREVAWSSYYAQALATYDALKGIRAVGVGGTSQFLAGLHGSASQLALNAAGLTHINPALARETLLHALSTQHGATSATPYRFPWSETGVDSFSDGVDNTNPSDSYFVLPSVVATYVAASRDFDFFEAKASYWPIGEGEVASVREHLGTSLLYAQNSIGLAAHGLVAMGTGDFGRVLLQETTEAPLPEGVASVLNAAMAVHGLPLLVELLTEPDPVMADSYEEWIAGQVTALELAWNGSFYERAFSESGSSLTQDIPFLATQVLPVLAEVVDIDRRDALLDMLVQRLTTDGTSAAVEGGAVLPVVGAWFTEALAKRDPDEAWLSILSNSLAARADVSPDQVASVWAGTGSYASATQGNPGASTTFGSHPDADYTGASAETHSAMLRASIALLGVSANPAGWRIDPRLPSENYSVSLPALTLQGTATSIAGSITAQSQVLMRLVVTLPSGLRGVDLMVRVKEAEVPHEIGTNNTVSFDFPTREQEAVGWSITGL